MRIVTCLTLIAGSALAQSAQPFEMPRMPNGKPNCRECGSILTCPT